MNRILNPLQDGGAPYINGDFFNILQNNNLESYKIFLDNINDKFGVLGNSGIIIKGVRQVIDTTDPTGIYFDFTNSMIYLDGDFLENAPGITGVTQITYTTSSFFLVRETIVEQREGKVSGLASNILNKSYFIISSTQPANESYIEIPMNTLGLCERYLDRILRYSLAQDGQIFMTYKKDYFDSQGKGIGPMSGFAYCNGNNGTQDLRGCFLIGYDPFGSTTPDLNPTATQTNYGKLKNRGGLDRVQLDGSTVPNHDHGGWTDVADNNLRHYHTFGVRLGFEDDQNTQNNANVNNLEWFATSRSLPSSSPVETKRYDRFWSKQNNEPDQQSGNAWTGLSLNEQTGDGNFYRGNFQWFVQKEQFGGLYDHVDYGINLLNSNIPLPRHFDPTSPRKRQTGNNEKWGIHTHDINANPISHENLPQYHNVIYYQKISV